MILRLLTWFFGGLTVYAAMLFHKPFAEWTSPCPPSGFYEDHSECVPGLEGLFLIVPAFISFCIFFVLNMSLSRQKRRDSVSGTENN